MPHGYKCDRCEGFVEQDLRGFECHEQLRGDSTEIVRIDNPALQVDSGIGGVECYTLCQDCRKHLVDEVRDEGAVVR